MGAKAGTALKFLQWFIRGIQFACAALILAIYFNPFHHNPGIMTSRYLDPEGPWVCATPHTHVSLTHDPLSITDVIDRVRSPRAGAIVMFAGQCL
jgi:hypothetical protein